MELRCQETSLQKRRKLIITHQVVHSASKSVRCLCLLYGYYTSLDYQQNYVHVNNELYLDLLLYYAIITAIDPYLREWGCTAWGMHLRKLSVLFQFFHKPECPDKCAYTDLHFPRDLNTRMMNTVSPVLKIGLQLLGVWPGVLYSIPYWLIYVFSILIVQYFQYRYVFEHLKISELSNLIDSLPAALDYSLTIFKVISLWMHRRVIYQLVTAMDNDWRECVIIDQHLYVMTIKANISHFCSNVMFSINAIVAVFYLLSGYVIHFVYLSEDYNVTLRQFPIKVQFPIETQQSPIFELLAIILFLHVMLNSCTLSILNALISTLMFHVSGQIDILCQGFETISTKTLPHKTFTSTLGILIERHNRVFLFSDNIEKLFSFIALMQVVWNTLVICSLGFIIIISFYIETSVITIVKTIFTYLAVIVEVFILCFAGEYLSLKSKAIADAAYESLWYDLPLNQRKIIMFIIMRAQKQVMITAGRITNLSLETFTSIVKASASYVSVLHAMYSH